MYQTQKNGYVKDMASDIAKTSYGQMAIRAGSAAKSPKVWGPIVVLGAVAGLAAASYPDAVNLTVPNYGPMVSATYFHSNETIVATLRDNLDVLGYDQILRELSTSLATAEGVKMKPGELDCMTLQALLNAGKLIGEKYIAFRL